MVGLGLKYFIDFEKFLFYVGNFIKHESYNNYHSIISQIRTYDNTLYISNSNSII